LKLGLVTGSFVAFGVMGLAVLGVVVHVAFREVALVGRCYLLEVVAVIGVHDRPLSATMEASNPPLLVFKVNLGSRVSVKIVPRLECGLDLGLLFWKV
jgi:hypothetical protein